MKSKFPTRLCRISLVFIYFLVFSTLATQTTDAEKLIALRNSFDSNTTWALLDGTPFMGYNLDTELQNWTGVLCITDEGTNSKIKCLDLDGFLNDIGTSNCGPNCNPLNPEVVGSPGIGMQGAWPNDIAFDAVEKFSMAGNWLNQPFPDLSGFLQLDALFIDSCGLTGILTSIIDSIPLELRLFNAGNNQFAGPITEEFIDAFEQPNSQLFLTGNQLSGVLPDLSGSNIVDLSLARNKFTFSDLLPNYLANLDLLQGRLDLNPQQPVYRDTTIIVGYGLPFELDIEVDASVETSTYRWRLDSLDVPELTSSENKLQIDSFTLQDTGTYVCRISNSVVTDLLLISHPIRILGCNPTRLIVDTTLCLGSSLTLGEDIVNIGRDTIIILRGLSASGCDSVVQINFREVLQPGINPIDTNLCAGETLLLEGIEYAVAGTFTQIASLPAANGCDSIYQINITLSDTSLGIVDIGTDFVSCSAQINLNANQPPGTFGTWRLPSGVTVTDENDPLGDIELTPGNNRIGWVLATSVCAFDSSFINVFYEPPLPYFPDTFTVFDGWNEPTELDFNLLDNDPPFEFVSGDWFINPLGDTATIGRATLDDSGNLRYERVPCLRDTFSLRYLIGTNNCPADTARVWLEIQPKLQEGITPPNVVTFNFDEKNDRFVIPLIEADKEAFPNSEITVYSSTNEIVFRQRNYQNDWRGQDQQNRPVPAGTYHFVIFYGDDLPPHRGYLKVIRGR